MNTQLNDLNNYLTYDNQLVCANNTIADSAIILEHAHLTNNLERHLNSDTDSFTIVHYSFTTFVKFICDKYNMDMTQISKKNYFAHSSNTENVFELSLLTSIINPIVKYD